MLDVLTADAAAKHGHDYPPHRSHSPLGDGSFFAQMPLSILSSVLRKQTSTPALDNPPPSVPTEPETPVVSPALSRAASLSSNATAEGKPKKKAPRPKTTYNLAVPPPIARQKLHLRPKVLLQLHQVVPGRRPKPVYEVIPFSLLAPRSTRRLARTYKRRERLCPNDLLVVRTEAYENSEEGRTDDERWGTRDVLGIICPGKKADKDPSEKAEILLDDGTGWEITRMPNGGYEFSYVDDHGLTLKRRWIPKGTGDERKFNFSTINPTTRRHPIIASMSRASIDILDAYNMPTATSPSTPGSQYFPTPLPTPLSESFMEEQSNERLPVKTDDALRMFIVLSGIWVAFSENWSAAYSLAKMSPPPLNTGRPAPNRAVSMSFLDSPRSASPASTSASDENSRPKLARSGTHKPATRTSPAKTRSRRSNSTGNAELISKNGASRKRFGLAFEDEALPETEEERQEKRSVELLRIKELALTDPTSPTLDASPIPVTIIVPPTEGNSPTKDERARKTQSAYNPVTTAGLWDSGVVDGPGKKSRPTSMVVVNQKKEKAKRKQEKGKEKRSGGLRRFFDIFRRDKS